MRCVNSTYPHVSESMNYSGEHEIVVHYKKKIPLCVSIGCPENFTIISLKARHVPKIHINKILATLT
eukprot:2530646-Ditylum_brightwellii.AAC.1